MRSAGRPASPNAKCSTGSPRRRRASMASLAASVAETGIVARPRRGEEGRGGEGVTVIATGAGPFLAAGLADKAAGRRIRWSSSRRRGPNGKDPTYGGNLAHLVSLRLPKP